MGSKENYCKLVNKYSEIEEDTNIRPLKDGKWFYSFLFTLLNNNTFELIKSKKHNSRLEKFFNIIKSPEAIAEYTEQDIKDFTEDLIQNMQIEDLYKYLIKYNLVNYFLLPFYLKYLGFKCLSFEYYKEQFHGGIYNYLHNIDKKNNIFDYGINDHAMNGSRGVKYDQRKDNNPDFILINMWNDKDKFFNNIEDDTILYNDFSSKIVKQFSETTPDSIEFNGYKYKLKSYLLSNTNELKKSDHTITITNCDNNDWYAFANLTITPNAGLIKSLLYPKGNTTSCTKLIKLNSSINIKKTVILPNNKCEFINKNDINKKGDNYTFSTQKGKRILIYMKDEKQDPKNSKENKGKKQEEKDPNEHKGKKQQETQEEKDKREKNENICTTIIAYLNKIKANTEKDIIFDKIKKDKDYIEKRLKDLEEKEKKHAENKAELEKIKENISKEQKDSIKQMTDLLKAFKETQGKKKYS